MAYLKQLVPRLRAAIALTLGIVSLQGACSSTVAEELILAELAGACLLNSDCRAPLVCAFESCHAECVSSRDCQDGARCVAAARPYKVCQFEEERLCERTSDCQQGLVCGIDGECRDKCLTQFDCVEGQLCVGGTCADEDELNEAGLLAPTKGASYGQEGAPCVYVSDCSSALLCRNQACLPECKADKDCGEQQKCADNRCVVGDGPRACAYSSQCESEPGKRCLAGHCHCMCAEARDCPAGELCDDCGCYPDPDAKAQCVYNSDCPKAGQLCQSGRCDCECKTNVDCGEGRVCDDCGCKDEKDPVDGIVYGNVKIQSSLDLLPYRGVTEIHGNLEISGPGIVDLGDTFDELSRVENTLDLKESERLTSLSFPKLVYAKKLYLSNGLLLSTIKLRKLKTAELEIAGMPELVTLKLDSFDGGSIKLNTLDKLKTLELLAATALQGLTISDATALEQVSLPLLLELPGPLTIQSQSLGKLSLLSAPNLKSVGHDEAAELLINNTALTSLAQLGKAPWSVLSTKITLSSNPNLSNCAIEAFRAAGTAKVKIVDFGNLTCDCDGPVCKSAP